MRDRIKWASGIATISTTIVGPEHDPYSRTRVDIRLNNRDFVLVSCALAGDWFDEIGAKTDQRLAQVHGWGGEAEVAEFNRIVSAMTQFEPKFWFDELWDRVRARRGDDYYAFDGIYM